MSYTGYAALCHEFAPDHDPRHVEAFMRVEHPTLDHLDRDRFRREAEIAGLCINVAGVAEAEKLARSFAL